MNEIYDLLILGSGPAGASAGIYADRFHLSSAIIGEIFGGAVMYPSKITNFPSYSQISGIDLIQNFQNHLNSINYSIIENQISKVNKKEDMFEVFLRNNTSLLSKNILIALGTTRKKLNVKNEEKFTGKGVHYCAICDAAFYKNKDVIVVGSGEGAANAVILLDPIADNVYHIIRSNELKASPETIETLNALNNYTLIKNNEIESIEGDNFVSKVILKEPFNDSKELNINGIFIEIGGAPNSAILNDLGIQTDDNGYIIVDNNQRTNIPNIWAAGDITNLNGNFKQIINACSQGAVAANDIYNKINNLK